ncbi:hypothetical protein [Maribacter litoralis]|uniref:hypothetical protein n=1 Tax=Maribacter litoralis TaxID=2059726 RepID=UPI003F5CC9D5
MKIRFYLVLTYMLNLQSGLTQETKLYDFVKTELTTGKYKFELMTAHVTPRVDEEPLLLDESGKIIYPKVDLEQIEDEPNFVLKSSGSIFLNIQYNDFILTIRPVDNTYFPLIKINLKSGEALFNKAQICLTKQVSISDNKNGFKSPWKGFQWLGMSKNNSSIISPRLTLGKLKEGGKIYLEILWVENESKRHYRLIG